MVSNNNDATTPLVPRDDHQSVAANANGYAYAYGNSDTTTPCTSVTAAHGLPLNGVPPAVDAPPNGSSSSTINTANGYNNNNKHAAHKRGRQQTVRASSSFFGLPRGWSSGSLRDRLNLPAPDVYSGEIDWVSIIVVYWITLVSEASRGLMLPSTWPYLQSLGGTKVMLGVFVASFSIGRMATTVPLGYLSDKYSTSVVLSCCSLIQILGHILYAFSPTVWCLLAARIVVGFGSSTMSICRAHLTRAVPVRQRTHHFAYLSALQFVGFAVLPGAGGLLAELPEHNLFFGAFALNGYTYPAWTLVFCNVLALFFISAFYFNPPTRQQIAARNALASPDRNRNNDTRYGATDATDEDNRYHRRADIVALVVCLLINVSFRGIVAELETVTTPFLMEHYGMSYATSSYYITAIGCVGLFVYLGFKPIARRYSDRNLVLFGLIFVMVGAVPLSFTPLTQHMSKWTYVACIAALWAIAYPIGQTAVLALFSKVLADLPAGGFLGIFSASGSLARIIFACLAGKIWGALGREAVFACIIGYIVPSIALSLWAYNRLVPAFDL